MDIHISKESEVPLHEQIAAQLVFLIGTGGLKPGARSAERTSAGPTAWASIATRSARRTTT